MYSLATRRMSVEREDCSPRCECNFGGCSSPLIKACISANRIGSASSHRTHWNLRPPVFKTMKCIGLRHFGHLGGGCTVTTLTLYYSGASITELPVAG